MDIQSIRKEEILNFLDSNKFTPIYVVRDNIFLISVFKGSNNKFTVTSYLHDDKGEPLVKEVSVDKLDSLQKFKETDMFLTPLGASKLLDKLESTPA